MANLVELMSGILVGKITCEIDEVFQALWERMLQRVKIPLQKKDKPDDSETDFPLWETGFYDSKDDIRPYSLTNGFKAIDVPLLLIFDEFDRVEDEETKQLFSDAIKSISDNCPNVTIMLVGVADNIEELIEAHPSTERCITQVPLPLMEREELAEIINNGFSLLEINLEPQIKPFIITLSQGFPYYAHSLSKNLAICSIISAQHRDIPPSEVQATMDHLFLAVDDTVSDTYETVKRNYRNAIITSSSRKPNMYKYILLAAALQKGDEEFHLFRAVDLAQQLSQLFDKTIISQMYSRQLSTLCEEKRGSILKRHGAKNSYRYSFRDPMTRSFVLMKALQERVPKLKELILSYEN